MTTRVLITGSRWLKRRSVIAKAFAKHVFEDDIVVVSGACPRGADAMCEEFAHSRGYEVERYPADWAEYGKGAGMLRNQEMVDTEPDLCLAFPTKNSVGTYDCIRRAKKAGIETHIYES